MAIRESEALKNWCPFTRAAWARPNDDTGWKTRSDGAVGFNRALVRPGSDEHAVGNCIGSECMAWRSTGSIEIGRTVEIVGLEKKRNRIQCERVGYCGLAGAPGLTDAEITAKADADPSARSLPLTGEK